ncbi:MAG: hypothetical protein ACI35P_01045 [Bacillus sp. (in: firmicutes)]
MEKILVKTAIYTCIVSFSLLFVFVPRTWLTTDVNGMSSSAAYTYPEYFFMLARYSIMITFIVVIGLFLIKYYKERKEKKHL